MEGSSGSDNDRISACAKTKIMGYIKLVKKVKLRDLKLYGYVQCDISNYEAYTMVELVDEFCSEVPCFFKSYDNLQLLFTHRFEKATKAMVWLRCDLLAHPVAPVQAKIARIIHQYFRGLPWVNKETN